MAAVLPVGLVVAGRRCVVVGAGPVGARRARALAAAGAAVVVVAPEVDRALEAAARRGELVVERRPVDPAADVAGARVVVCATGDRDVDEAVARAATEAGALVNRADGAAAGDLTVPAVVDRGPLRVAVHGGPDRPSPAVTRLVAGRLDAGLDELLGLDATALALLVDVVAEVRAELQATRSAGAPDAAMPVTPGPSDWQRGLDSTMLELICRGRRAEAKDHLLACLSSS